MSNKKHEEDFKWAVYGISCGVLLFILGATYAIIRIIDWNWANWQLPAILGIVYFAIVSIGAMVISLWDVKAELDQKKAGSSNDK